MNLCGGCKCYVKITVRAKYLNQMKTLRDLINLGVNFLANFPLNIVIIVTSGFESNKIKKKF